MEFYGSSKLKRRNRTGREPLQRLQVLKPTSTRSTHTTSSLYDNLLMCVYLKHVVLNTAVWQATCEWYCHYHAMPVRTFGSHGCVRQR
jgi:hypothetical protein